jgi:hypothetical protein
MIKTTTFEDRAKVVLTPLEVESLEAVIDYAKMDWFRLIELPDGYYVVYDMEEGHIMDFFIAMENLYDGIDHDTTSEAVGDMKYLIFTNLYNRTNLLV